MKHTVLALIGLATTVCSAQESFFENLASSKPNKVRIFEVPNNLNTVSIRMPYGGNEIEYIPQKLEDRTIYKIQLVYSKYKSSNEFDQEKLNINRIKELNSKFPGLVKNQLIEWELVEQTAGRNREESTNYFHGFVFTCREKPSELLREQELEFVSSMFEDVESESPVSPDGISVFRAERTINSAPSYRYGNDSLELLVNDWLRFPLSMWGQKISGEVQAGINIDSDGEVTDVFISNSEAEEFSEEVENTLVHLRDIQPAQIDGKDSIGFATLNISFNQRNHSTSVSDLEFKMGKPNKVLVRKKGSVRLSRNAISSTLERNNWSNMSIVADVTGSMSPFTGQMIKWYRRNYEDSSKVKQFVLFNDGDDKPDNMKRPGSTGGIYSAQATDSEGLRSLLFEAMSYSGGDNVENDIEAILASLRLCDPCEVILIADNYSDMRDVNMASQINRPVHIILCGPTQKINTSYLDLAAHTNGSIHFGPMDITDLKPYMGGELLVINRGSYKYRNGKFSMVDYEFDIKDSRSAKSVTEID